MLILPYPNNPTGGIMTREDLEKIAAVLRGTNILVLSDEIYSELTYGTKHCSIASIPDMWERTIYVSGFSKAFAMTGWRLGYLCAPKPLAKQMLKIHQYAIMCAPTVSQYAAIVALQECDDEVRKMVRSSDRGTVCCLEGGRNKMKSVTLNNGVKMPILGYGVYQVDPKECERCVSDALEVGYRLIDTAQAYYNEEGVGAAISNSGIPREELFLTTKVWITNAGYEKAKASIEESLKKLKTDYIDLLLIHQPIGDYYGTYRAMEEAYEEGILKAIGVSNFYPDRFVDISNFVKVQPAVNQIETHPFQQQKQARKYLESITRRLNLGGRLQRAEKICSRIRFCRKLVQNTAKPLHRLFCGS